MQAERKARRRRDGTPIRCVDRCWPQPRSTTVYTHEGVFIQTYCRICRWAIPAVELMRPKLQLAPKGSDR